MKFLFSHRDFPAQFEHILQELSNNPRNDIVFLTASKNNIQIKNVKKIEYKLKRRVPKNCHSYLREYEESVIHGQAATEAAIALKRAGFIPNVICAHPNGNSMFLKDVFPNTPIINFCEWFCNSKDSDLDFGGKILIEDTLARNRCKNAQLLIDLVSCDKAICPTMWQKKQFPEIFHKKIQVVHGGIDTDYFAPHRTVFNIPKSKITFSKCDKVITFIANSLGESSGFPQFMIMLEKLFEKRTDINVVIVGRDEIYYGAQLSNTTYKRIMLEKLNLDETKIHFIEKLSKDEYRKLLQVSTVHVYLTSPCALSNLMLEAMSSACIVIGSKTPPVEEVIKDEYNGLLVDFFNTDGLLNKIEYALNNQDTLIAIRKNARKTIVERYNLKMMMPKILNIIYTTARK